jgi:MFS family permease
MDNATATAVVVVQLDVWTALAALACGAISARIVTYRRGDAQYKLRVSLCAWVLAAATGCYSLSVVLGAAVGQPVDSVSPWLVVVLLVLLGLVFKARGNVASILRLDWTSPWSGAERRMREHR